MQVKIGEETRQIVSGIAQHYDSEDLVGKKAVVVTNLKPAKLRGVESQGMILAASNKRAKPSDHRRGNGCREHGKLRIFVYSKTQVEVLHRLT